MFPVMWAVKAKNITECRLITFRIYLSILNSFLAILLANLLAKLHPSSVMSAGVKVSVWNLGSIGPCL